MKKRYTLREQRRIVKDFSARDEAESASPAIRVHSKTPKYMRASGIPEALDDWAISAARKGSSRHRANESPTNLGVARCLARRAVPERLRASDSGLAAERAGIVPAHIALLRNYAAFSRTQLRTDVREVAHISLPSPPATGANALANGASFEANVAGIGHRAGIGDGLATFRGTRSSHADRQFGRSAHVAEVHVQQVLAVGQSHGDGVVVGLGIAALVIAILPMEASILVFPAISSIAVFPMDAAIIGLPAFGSVVFAMDITVIFLPAISRVAIFPMIAGGGCSFPVASRRSHCHGVSSRVQIFKTIGSIRISVG